VLRQQGSFDSKVLRSLIFARSALMGPAKFQKAVFELMQLQASVTNKVVVIRCLFSTLWASAHDPRLGPTKTSTGHKFLDVSAPYHLPARVLTRSTCLFIQSRTKPTLQRSKICRPSLKRDHDTPHFFLLRSPREQEWRAPSPKPTDGGSWRTFPPRLCHDSAMKTLTTS
jgi:hypothetical protein